MIDSNFLLKIDSPADLRKLSVDELPALCQELRTDIIHECAANPGHLASSLGVVELTVALHYLFNTPYDRLVWDVGHQAYGHKILTGRRDQFHTNRQYKGIKPFPSPEESEYDTFACGHASNSISAALGMATASMLKGENNRHIVAIIGDGAMSGGLAFEGLNNASETPNNMLIILNDNNMSIDKSVGGMKQYLLQLQTSPTYNKMRFRIAKRFKKWGLLDDKRKRAVIRFNNSIKSLVAKQQNIFEGLNIRYFGPIDGHNITDLITTIQNIKEMTGPKILHIHTKKGKGLEVAEENPTVWHAPGKFNVDSCERLIENKPNMPPKFQDVFGETLVELAHRNERIVGITPAMPTGCSMSKLMDTFPTRSFDVGIAEGHAMTFSAGMAKEGLMPFCNIYSAFAQRAYDNIIHDTALLKLPVVLCLDRAGIVGEDGPTHHGVFDIPSLRPVPNLTIASPYNECELRHLMYTAQLNDKGTFVIRYPRGNGSVTDWRCEMQEIEVGTSRWLKEGNDLAVISLGPLGVSAANAIEIAEKETGKSIAHIDLRFVKPLDQTMLHRVGGQFTKVITIEDGAIAGGAGSAIMEWFADHNYDVKVKRLGVPDAFIEHGDIKSLYAQLELDEEGLIHNILSQLACE